MVSLKSKRTEHNKIHQCCLDCIVRSYAFQFAAILINLEERYRNYTKRKIKGPSRPENASQSKHQSPCKGNKLL